MTALLRAKSLSKTFGTKANSLKVVKEIDLQIQRGEFLGIMGPSGSGKSTLLNILSSIDSPTNGLIEIDGHELTNLNEDDLSDFRRNKLGFIFQDYHLLDTLTVKENILLPMTFSNLKANDIERRIEELTNQFELTSIINKYPYEISGGQQQRTAVCRAIANHPSIIFADEPTGALDSKSSYQLLQTLSHLNEEHHSTILMVTHDSYAASFCSRILFIKDGSIFTEIHKGDLSRKQFFQQILDILATLGGGQHDFK